MKQWRKEAKFILVNPVDNNGVPSRTHQLLLLAIAELEIVEKKLSELQKILVP